ncbi:hypothetical protein RYX56_01680 [Alkalihalophilus lindianensis]|uniref:Uncharacterized protein n=1 Tax=Alkalihalophilus lindianensis TaxID=1630542 RepID=A0ABU3X5C9_9BACI|nr:hypothetical protein [Alkalihalophilus lindianensis]MDV2683079.1 hypothetical protein [Alkalihalophilus lindianensis]
MNEVWSIGPLLVRQSWVVLILIVLIGYFLSVQFFFDILKRKKEESEMFWNGFFAFFVTFQFSKLVLNPSVALSDPIAVLATPSGANEWMVAWVIMSIYLWWSTRVDITQRLNLFTHITGAFLLIETMYYAFFPFTTISGSIRTSVVLMMMNTLILGLIYFQHRRNEQVQRVLGQVLVFYGGIKGVLSLFISVRMLDYSLPNWFYFMIFIAGLITLSSQTKNKEAS